MYGMTLGFNGPCVFRSRDLRRGTEPTMSLKQFLSNIQSGTEHFYTLFAFWGPHASKLSADPALLFLRESLMVSFNLPFQHELQGCPVYFCYTRLQLHHKLPPTPRILRYSTYSHVIRMSLFENATNIWLELAFDSRPTNTCTSTYESTTIRMQEVTWSSEVQSYYVK